MAHTTEASTAKFQRIPMEAAGSALPGLGQHFVNKIHRAAFRRVARKALQAKLNGQAALFAYAAYVRKIYPYLDASVFPSVDAEAVREQPSVLGGRAGSSRLTAEWFRPKKDRPRGIVFYIHGGSFIAERSPRVTDFMSRICASAGARVFAPRYRLAPEAPCPAAVVDAVAAYEWLIETYPDEPIVALAESSGASVLLAALQKARDSDLPLPNGVLLFSPWVDLALTGWSVIAATITGSSPHTMDTCALTAQLYLAGRPPTDPVASPVYGSFARFPLMQVHVSKADVLYDDAEKLARRMAEFHVPVTIREWTSQTHVWERYTNNPAAKISIQAGAEFIRRCLER